MKYKMRAYRSRQEAESGRSTPIETCETGSWITAQHLAVQMSKDHGYAIIANTVSGSWHGYANGILVITG